MKKTISDSAEVDDNDVIEVLESLILVQENALNKDKAEVENAVKLRQEDIEDLKKLLESLGKPVRGVSSADLMREHLCWHNLSYCCGLGKKCFKRDAVLKLLNIRKKDFKRIKESMVWG